MSSQTITQTSAHGSLISVGVPYRATWGGVRREVTFERFEHDGVLLTMREVGTDEVLLHIPPASIEAIYDGCELTPVSSHRVTIDSVELVRVIDSLNDVKSHLTAISLAASGIHDREVTSAIEITVQAAEEHLRAALDALKVAHEDAADEVAP